MWFKDAFLLLSSNRISNRCSTTYATTIYLCRYDMFTINYVQKCIPIQLSDATKTIETTLKRVLSHVFYVKRTSGYDVTKSAEHSNEEDDGSWQNVRRLY